MVLVCAERSSECFTSPVGVKSLSYGTRAQEGGRTERQVYVFAFSKGTLELQIIGLMKALIWDHPYFTVVALFLSEEPVKQSLCGEYAGLWARRPGVEII